MGPPVVVLSSPVVSPVVVVPSVSPLSVSGPVLVLAESVSGSVVLELLVCGSPLLLLESSLVVVSIVVAVVVLVDPPLVDSTSVVPLVVVESSEPVLPLMSTTSSPGQPVAHTVSSRAPQRARGENWGRNFVDTFNVMANKPQPPPYHHQPPLRADARLLGGGCGVALLTIVARDDSLPVSVEATRVYTRAMLRVLQAFVFIAALVASTSAVAGEAASAPTVELTRYRDDPLAVSSFVLDNGLTVFISENHARPEVFGAVVVRTGGRNDPADQTGIAHYLEHMLFKGTQSLGTTDWTKEAPIQAELERLYEELRDASPEQAKAIRARISAAAKRADAFAIPNEMDKLLRELGSTGLNAFTSYDETVYHNTFPASQLRPWLEIYAHRFVDPVFRLFPTELEAVYEEKNIALDTTGYELFRRFMAAAFKGHPYGRNDILGEVEHLKRPSLETMKAYFEEYYVPSNMALVLSGDVDPVAARAGIEATFGTWASAPSPKPKQYTVQPFEPNERLRLRATPVRFGGVAFHTVPERDPDFAALRVLRLLLSNEQRTGLIDGLAEDGKVLLAVHVPADFAEVNLDAVAYLPRLVTQTFAGAERAVLSTFARLGKGDFDDETFEALKQGLLVQEAEQWEDNRSRALMIGHAFVARGSWQGYLDYLSTLRSLDKAKVTQVAQRVFGERRLIVRSRMGFPKKTRLTKPKFPPVTPRRGVRSEFAKKLEGVPKSEPAYALVNPRRDVEHLRLQPGVTLRSNRNPHNDLYQLEFVFGVGHDAIPELALLAEYLPRIGTTALEPEAFRERLFALSTRLEVESEPDAFTLRIAGPRENLADALILVDQLMHAAKPDRKTLRKLRWEIWGWRRVAREDASVVVTALRDHVLYGRNSRYQQEYGPASARGTSAGELLDAWTEAQRYHLSIRHAGASPASDVAADVRAHIAFGAKLGAPVAPVVYPRDIPNEPRVYFVPKRKAVQSRMWFVVDSGRLQDNERAAADAFAEYFGGGTGGLVFSEVREYRALAYAAAGRLQLDPTPNPTAAVMAFVGCQTDKTLDAIDVVLGLMQDFPVERERMPAVIDALLRAQETQTPTFRELQEDVETWKLEGYRGDPRASLSEAYRGLRYEDVEAFHAAHVEGRPVSIFIVGDPRRLRRKDLARYGDVVVLDEHALFSD